MPVSVARHAGFCMGVKRAVDGAVKAAQEGKPIVSFGELAHNPCGKQAARGPAKPDSA